MKTTDKTWAKTVSITILVVPMILLFSSMAGNRDFRRMKPQWQRSTIELIAIVGTGVGSLFTSVYVYINMTDKKN